MKITIFGIKEWEKLIQEINKIDQVLLFEDQSKIDKITELKNDVMFFINNIDQIFPHCLDTDYVRLKHVWVEIKNPSRDNLEDVHIEKIQSIIRILNLSIQEQETEQYSENDLMPKVNFIVSNQKKVKFILYVILFIMVLQLFLIFFRNYIFLNYGL